MTCHSICRSLLLAWIAAGCLIGASLQAASPVHPLDPLTAEEITAAAELFQKEKDFPPGGLFASLVLSEPPKGEVQAFAAGKPFRREAAAVVYDRQKNRTFAGIADLTKATVTRWQLVPGVQPLVLESEYQLLADLVRANPDWQAAMKLRGITDFDTVHIDLWAPGLVLPGEKQPRFARGLSYLKREKSEKAPVLNFYGRPIEGVLALVNMNTQKIVITDTGVLPIPLPGQDLDEKSIAHTHGGKLREPLQPLVTTQPAGPSYHLEGNEVRWQNWRFRFALHPRDGVVLYTVGYEDGGKLRPILHRGSLSEMVVPYGETDSNWSWRSAFDVGEYGVGMLSAPLERGLDVPEHAQLIDALIAGEAGEPKVLEKRVAIFERDGGLLWKHADYTGWSQGRRARELVLFFITTIGNYDYGVQWVFHQDGTLEADAVLSGIMLAKGVKEKAQPEHQAGGVFGHLVAPHIVAPNHQHFFSFRLDLDVDGERNSVVEMNTEADPDDESLNDITHHEMPLKTEKEARRKLSLDTARKWAIINPCIKNSLGAPTAYVLVPGENSVPYLAGGSSVRRRAGFINHHFWATQHHPDELYAAGEYPNQSPGGDGLPKWVADDQSLDNEDVVVWYTLGLTHIPRPEEWPIMNSTHVGFKLIPAGFFSRNPALDVRK